MYRNPIYLNGLFLDNYNQEDSTNSVIDGWHIVKDLNHAQNKVPIIPNFLTNLMKDRYWSVTTKARLFESKSSNSNIEDPNSPGLIIIISSDDSLGFKMAQWLIVHEIDRVCLLLGGLDRLLKLNKNSVTKFLLTKF